MATSDLFTLSIDEELQQMDTILDDSYDTRSEASESSDSSSNLSSMSSKSGKTRKKQKRSHRLKKASKPKEQEEEKTEISPEVKEPAESTTVATSSTAKEPVKASKTYDYMTKLNYLFRETRFFVASKTPIINTPLSTVKGLYQNQFRL